MLPIELLRSSASGRLELAIAEITKAVAIVRYFAPPGRAGSDADLDQLLIATDTHN